MVHEGWEWLLRGRGSALELGMWRRAHTEGFVFAGHDQEQAFLTRFFRVIIEKDVDPKS